jgi:predicted O-methyltransferase YrrM
MKQRYHLLEGLIREHNYKKIAEIGATGYGKRNGVVALYLLENLDLDLYIAIDTIDRNFPFSQFNKYKGTRFIKASGLEAAKLCSDNYFDLVFLDELAHLKSLEERKQDILAWEKKVRKGGILSGHDYDKYRHKAVAKAVDSIYKDVNLLLEEHIYGGTKEPTNYVWWVYK